MKTKTIIYLRFAAALLAVGAFVLSCSCGSSSTHVPKNIFVTQGNYRGTGGDSISVFPLTANGNVAPTTKITGTSGNTGTLYDPHGIAFDSKGNIYVANSAEDNSGKGFVEVYAASATGNATPTATISGTNTGIVFPRGIALDAKGNIYVTNAPSYDDDPGTDSVTVYAAGATGNATPTATITGTNTGLSAPNGVALDNKGNIYVANEDNASVTVYAAGATGNATPTATIIGTNTLLSEPHKLAVDASGKIYVTSGNGNNVTVFAAGATGNATPVATISGTGTGLSHPNGIALDNHANIYVANAGGSVTVYAAGATGNATPTATISGTNTGFNNPSGVLVHGIGLF